MRRLILCLCVTCFLVAPAEPIQASPEPAEVAASATAIDYGWMGLVPFLQADGSVWWYYCEYISPGIFIPLYGPWIEYPSTP